MKYVIKPDNGQFSIENLIAWLVATDKRFNETGSGIRLGVRVEDAVTASAGKPCIELQPDHHAVLAAAAEAPSAGYPPLYVVSPDGTQEKLPGAARAWLACIDALRDAKDEPPKAVAATTAEPAALAQSADQAAE